MVSRNRAPRAWRTDHPGRHEIRSERRPGSARTTSTAKDGSDSVRAGSASRERDQGGEVLRVLSFDPTKFEERVRRGDKVRHLPSFVVFAHANTFAEPSSVQSRKNEGRVKSAQSYEPVRICEGDSCE